MARSDCTVCKTPFLGNEKPVAGKKQHHRCARRQLQPRNWPREMIVTQGIILKWINRMERRRYDDGMHGYSSYGDEIALLDKLLTQMKRSAPGPRS